MIYLVWTLSVIGAVALLVILLLAVLSFWFTVKISIWQGRKDGTPQATSKTNNSQNG